MAQRTHAAMIQEHLGDRIIGRVCRDSTAIEARERPARQTPPLAPSSAAQPQRKHVANVVAKVRAGKT